MCIRDRVINEALSYGCTPLAFNSFHAAEDMLPDREPGRLIPPFSLRLFARELDEMCIRDSLYIQDVSGQTNEKIKGNYQTVIQKDDQ